MTAILLAMIMIPDTTLFVETFDQPQLDTQDTWLIEGTGSARIEDGRLVLQEDSNGVGLVAWLRQDWPANFKLTFNVEFSNNRGIGVFFVATTGALEGRTGDYDEYIRGDLDSYSLSFHRYFPDGRNNPGANLRRNSGFDLLSQAMPDPMLEAGRRYAVEITKEGAHLVVRVDDKIVHDVVDEGEFGPPHGAGRIGFRLRGDASCAMRLDDVNIYSG